MRKGGYDQNILFEGLKELKKSEEMKIRIMSEAGEMTQSLNLY